MGVWVIGDFVYTKFLWISMSTLNLFAVNIIIQVNVSTLEVYMCNYDSNNDKNLYLYMLTINIYMYMYFIAVPKSYTIRDSGVYIFIYLFMC